MLLSPNKNHVNSVKFKNQVKLSTVNKEFGQTPISQTDRLRLKKSDATPFHVPVMMSHIT